jgi:hypothetical protein
MVIDKKNIIIITLFSIIVIQFLVKGCGNSNNDNISVDTIVPPDTSFTEASINNTPSINTIIPNNWFSNITHESIDNLVDTSKIINNYLATLTIDSLVKKIGEKRLLLVFDDYFATKYYSDTIIVENDYEAIILDSVSTNRITNRRFFMKNLRGDRVITIDNRTRKLLIGGFVGDKLDRFEFGGSVAYMNKRNQILQYQYGILNETHRFTFMTTLSFRKKKQN